MLKWLRKYSKSLLMFFGIFLMISFLVPQAINQFGRDASQTLFTIDGHKVSAKEAQHIASQLRGVERATFNVFPAMLGVDTRNVDHWMMASEAARRGGFYGAAGDGPSIIPQAAQLAVISRLSQMDRFRMQFDPNFQQQIKAQIDQAATSATEGRSTIAAQNGLMERELDEGLSAAKGILRMRETYLTSPRLSENRLIRKAREALDQADMQVLFMSAEPDLTKVPDPSDAALQEHFEKYKDKTAGVDDNPFGYLRPRRYKLEYIELERKSIEAAIKVSAVDVQKRILGGELATVTDAALRKTQIETAIRKEQADKVYAEARLAIKTEILAATRGIASEGNFYTLPADWKRPAIAQIAERLVGRIKEATGVQIPLPTITIREAEWVTDAELGKLAGFGSATYRLPGGSAGVAQLFPVVKELRKPEEEKIDLPLQVGVPFPEPVDDFSGNRYFFTIIDVRAESPAESLAEVKSQVINDRKKADAYAALAAQVASFETIAAGQGLESLQEQAKLQGGVSTDLRAGVKVSKDRLTPADFAANSKAFIDAAVKKMGVLDPTIALEKAPPTDLYVAVAIPAKQGIAVAKFTSFSPATMEKYRAAARSLELSGARDLVDENEEILSHERLTKLLKVESTRGSKTDETDGTAKPKTDDKKTPAKTK